MYKGNQNDSSMSRATTSVLLDNTNQLFQKEIDNYTRLLEQDKRKFFRAQENKQELHKEHSQKTKELNELMSRNFKKQTRKKQGELKILEGQLEQTINGFNDVLACNKRLRYDIEELRKQRLNQKDGIKKLQASINELQLVVEEKKKSLEHQKEKAEINKHQILKLKTQNQDQARDWRVEASAKRNLLDQTINTKTFFRKSTALESKSQTTDSLPLVKHRLREVLHRNKERQKIIDNYQRTMETVRQVFADISEEGSHSKLEDITNTIIKQEEQHHLAYLHIDKLNKDIDQVSQKIEQTVNRIAEQREKNNTYKQALVEGPEDIKLRQAREELFSNYKQKINDFQQFIQNCGSSFEVLKQKFKVLQTSQLSQFNLQSQLAIVQTLVNEYYSNENVGEATNSNQLEANRNGKNISILQEKDQKSMEGMKEFAEEYWEKRRIRLDGK